MWIKTVKEGILKHGFILWLKQREESQKDRYLLVVESVTCYDELKNSLVNIDDCGIPSTWSCSNKTQSLIVISDLSVSRCKGWER